MNPRAPRPGLLVALAVAAALLLVACGSGGSNDGVTCLPNATLIAVADGAAIRADALAGPMVINLWATWCGPCRKELPDFQAVHEDLGDSVRFAGIDQGDSRDAVRKYLAEVGVDFDQFLDEDGALSDALRVTGLPVTRIVGADGTVITVHSGALSSDALRRLIHDTLAVG